MSAIDRAKALNEERMAVWHAARALLERVERSGRPGMNAEEREQYRRMEADLDRLELERAKVLGSDEAKREIEFVNEEMRRAVTPEEWAVAERRDQEYLDFFAGRSQNRSIYIDLEPARHARAAFRDGMTATELRVLQTDGGASGGSLTVPTFVENNVWSNFVNTSAMRRVGCTVLTTPGGEPRAVPRVVTHSVGTQIASQTTAIAGTDPVLGSMTLNAYDYGELCSVSNDMLEDSAVDVATFVGEEIGRGLGVVTDNAYVLGPGSTAPTGVITAAPTGAAGTVATGGTTIAQVNGISGIVDPFIDLQYSIEDAYRQRGAAFLVSRPTAGALRKARETGGTAGAYLWQPSPTAGMAGGEPDRFLGDPIYVDSNIASIASNAKIAVYGNWSAFWIRDVVGLRLERSTDLYFNLAQTAFRGIIRTDSNCVDLKALNVLKMSVA